MANGNGNDSRAEDGSMTKYVVRFQVVFEGELYTDEHKWDSLEGVLSELGSLINWYGKDLKSFAFREAGS